MKKILLFLGCLAAFPVWAQDAFSGEDFDNQSKIIVQDEYDASRCQAVRIAPKWYLTAAHCVMAKCDKKSCDIIVDMLQGDIYASAVVHHNESTHKRVFIQQDYKDGKIKSVRADLALIFFDPAPADYFFKLSAINKELSWTEFNKLLKQPGYSEQRERWQALENSRAKLYVVTNAMDRHVLQPIAVPDVSTDTQLVGTGFYYFDKLKYYIGPDMGVDSGLSGSGVVVPGGGIIGVVSTVAGQGTSKKDAEKVQGANKYFLFTPINHDNEEFIKGVFNMAKSAPKSWNITSVGKLPQLVSMDPKIAAMTEERLEEIFPDFAAAQEKGAIADKQ